MKINERLVKFNFSSRNNTNIKYIVVHDTANSQNGADADAHFSYFNGGNREASAHYFVDDSQILRIIKDSDSAWHCGDGHGRYGITNENSLGIEMCVNSDGDFEKTKKNALELIVFLMETYNIDFENVVRHYDASRKICTSIMSKNNWTEWYEFKNSLKLLIESKGFKDYREIIKLLYKNIFGRDGDYEGVNFWNEKLNDGYTFGDVLKEFAPIHFIKLKSFILIASFIPLPLT